MPIGSILEFTAYANFASVYSPETRYGRTYTSTIFKTPLFISSPYSSLSLHNTSDPYTTSSLVAVGEMATFFVNLTLPEGTTFLPNVRVNTFNDSNIGVLAITEVGLFSISSNVPSTGYFSSITSSSRAADTASVGFASMLNIANNQRNRSDIVVFYFKTVAPPVQSNVGGTNLKFISSVQFFNGSANITAEQPHSHTLKIVQPVLQWTVVWDTPSYGDAGDLLTGVVTISHTTVCVNFHPQNCFY